MATKKEADKLKAYKINVVLDGFSDIMFNRFYDHSKEVRPADQKFYLNPDGSNQLVLPSENIYAFLFGENPMGAAKVKEKRGAGEFIRVGQSHLFIDPLIIPFTDDKGKPIKFNPNTGNKGFGGSTPFYIYLSGGRTKLGSLSIKQEAQPRPVLKLPWRLSFTITLLDNAILDPLKLENWFNECGITVALGAHRPRFGRFQVKEWKVM